MSFLRGLRSPAGIAVALGTAGVVILTLREAVPVARMLLIDPGPLVPPPELKPNAYRDPDGHGLIAATCNPDPDAGVQRVVDLLGGLAPIDVAGQRVVIKPNGNSGMPAPASTSPEVLETVIRLLQEHGAREIVVGSRGLGRFRSILGSVSHALLEHADRPVLIVPRGAVDVDD